MSDTAQPVEPASDADIMGISVLPMNEDMQAVIQRVYYEIAARRTAESELDRWKEDARRYCASADFWRGECDKFIHLKAEQLMLATAPAPMVLSESESTGVLQSQLTSERARSERRRNWIARMYPFCAGAMTKTERGGVSAEIADKQGLRTLGTESGE